MRFCLLHPLWVVLASWFATSVPSSIRASDAVDFNRDVRPILAKHCYTCHGPDENAREAGLRLDVRDSAIEDRGGYRAVDVDDPDASEIMTRILSDDPDARMPPGNEDKRLSSDEIETLRSWIREGAAYQEHWTFRPPQRVAVPDVANADWCREPIDRYIAEKVERAGLAPSDEADRRDLIRRLFLDLTGLPPEPEVVERFASDPHPKALRRLVDELLASPEYGEHMAASWLDLARYADTNGYEKDRPRTVWPYRDWVINALNNDMPFDQFSIEQLAGDMLPEASSSQKVATGFHRNTMLNEEGGIDPLEYRYYAMIDRVATTGTVWLGLTTGCAQCHTHKYDPITHDDFYSLFALLNDADEPELELEDALMDQTRQTMLESIRAQTDDLVQKFLTTEDASEEATTVRAAFDKWLKQQLQSARDWSILKPVAMRATTPKLELTSEDSILARGDITKREVYELEFPPLREGERIEALRLEALPHESLPARGPGMAYYEGRRGDFFLSELSVEVAGVTSKLENASHSFGKISIGNGSADAKNVLDSDGSTGWSTATAEGEAHRLVVNLAEPTHFDQPWTLRLLFERHFAASLGHFRVSAIVVKEIADQGATDRQPAVASSQSAEVEAILASVGSDETQLPADVLLTLQRHFVQHADELSKHRGDLERLKKQLPEPTRTLVMTERSPSDGRTTYRHHRGEYLQPREEITPGVPDVFASMGSSNPQNRLELAQWLVSRANPLVGRVTVNRAWRHFFGSGIVRTAGDYGTQSEPPSHQELLDTLAVDFVDNDWSLKHLHHRIVHSATYRQTMGTPPSNDPDNRLLSRFPYRRLQAEQLRDSLLAASDKLVRHQGGPGVYPPQPQGVAELAYGGQAWPTSAGPDRFRRSVYTFRKRTAPFAAFSVFDAPTGEVCVARRDQSTTPLQALALLNDEMYVELARELAEVSLRECGDDASHEQIIASLYQRILSRPPTRDETVQVTSFVADLESSYPQPVERWMLVARALVNLDEAITIP